MALSGTNNPPTGNVEGGSTSVAEDSNSDFDDAYDKLIEIAERESANLAHQLRKIKFEGTQDEEMTALMEVLEAGIESGSSIDLDELLEEMRHELARREYMEATNGEKMEIVRSNNTQLVVQALNKGELPAVGVEFDVYANFVDEQGGNYEEYRGVVAEATCTGHRGQDEYTVEIDGWIKDIGDDASGVKGKLMSRNPEVKVKNEKREKNDWRNLEELEDGFLVLRRVANQQENS